MIDHLGWSGAVSVWTAAPDGRDHLRTVLRVEMETLDADGTRTNIESRYFVASLPRFRLADAQWLLLGCPGPWPPPPMAAGAERPRRSPPPPPAQSPIPVTVAWSQRTERAPPNTDLHWGARAGTGAPGRLLVKGSP